MAIVSLRGLINGRSTPITGADEGLISSIRIGTSGDNTLLSKAVLDTALALRTELASTTSGSSGASLVGADNKVYTNISGLSTFTLQDFIDRIDVALASAGGTAFSDATFRIQDNTDSSKEIAFEATDIATSTTRTIIMPDTDVDLGQIATNSGNISTNTSSISTNAGNISTNTGDISTNTSNISTNTSSISTLGTDVAALQTGKISADGSVDFSANQSMAGNRLTNVGDPTAAADAANKSYVDSVALGQKAKRSCESGFYF